MGLPNLSQTVWVHSAALTPRGVKQLTWLKEMYIISLSHSLSVFLSPRPRHAHVVITVLQKSGLLQIQVAHEQVAHEHLSDYR